MVYNKEVDDHGKPVKSLTGAMPLRRQVSEGKEIDRFNYDPESGEPLPKENPRKAADRSRSRPKGSGVPKALLTMVVVVALVCGAAYYFVPDFQDAVHGLVEGIQARAAKAPVSAGENSPPVSTEWEGDPHKELVHHEKIERLPHPSVEMKQHREKKALRAKDVEALVEMGEEEIVSHGATATSDVRGNLADPQVVLDPSVEDWLQDRWQCASDMEGTPIEGEHWIEVDLGGAAVPTKFLIDWENAHSDDYTVEGRLSRSDEWKAITTSENTGDRAVADKHLVDTVDIPSEWGKRIWTARVPDLNCDAPVSAVRYVRLVIHKPATAWAPSIWRFQVFGKKIRACQKSRR